MKIRPPIAVKEIWRAGERAKAKSTPAASATAGASSHAASGPTGVGVLALKVLAQKRGRVVDHADAAPSQAAAAAGASAVRELEPLIASDASSDDASEHLPAEKRTKTKDKKQTKKKKKSLRDLPFDDVEDQAALVQAHFERYTSKLTALEVDKSFEFDVNMFVDRGEPDAHAAWLRQRLPEALQKDTAVQLHQPLVLFMCGNAERAWDVVRGLQEGGARAPIAMLYARHMKVAEQQRFLERTRCPIAVGTPGRVGALLDCGALSLAAVRLLVVDMWRDGKGLTQWMYPQVADDLIRVLGQYAVAPLRAGTMQLCLY